MTISWNEALALFAEKRPDFAPRDNQNRLAVRIENAFANGQHLMAQAGCGTGKTFAAGVPAIAQSFNTDLPVIYSTATKALQDQLAKTDLPALQMILQTPQQKKDKVLPFTFTVIKGRSNYVCMAKLSEMSDKPLARKIQTDTERKDFNGEIEDLTVGLNGFEKAQLSTTADECPGKSECPFGEICFAEKAKAAAKLSNIVVVNHAVLAIDRAINAIQIANGVPEEAAVGLLPQFGGVVVDEAHELGEFVTNALGGEATRNTFARLGTEVFNFLSNLKIDDDVDPEVVKDLKKSMKESATKLSHQITTMTDSLYAVVGQLLANRSDKRNKTLALDEKTVKVLVKSIDSLIKALIDAGRTVEETSTYGNDEGTQKKRRLVKKIKSAQTRLSDFKLSDDATLVRWLEVGEEKEGSNVKRGDTLKWAPLKIDDFLRFTLLDKAPVIFQSATLAEGNKFDFLATNYGVDDYDSFDAGTPFNFKRQARTFIPQIAPPAGLTVNQWRSSWNATSKECVRAADGRSLLTYTSKTEMEEGIEAIGPMVEAMGHRVLIQGEASSAAISRAFAQDEHSVLFGMKTFFTGIDIQGDSLRFLGLNKLPFIVPSDVVHSRRVELLDAELGPWSGFNKLTIPLMLLATQQLYGRLIRTVSDWGVVAIGDSRLYGKNAKSYGKRIMNALPDAPVLTQLSEATNFLTTGV